MQPDCVGLPKATGLCISSFLFRRQVLQFSGSACLTDAEALKYSAFRKRRAVTQAQIISNEKILHSLEVHKVEKPLFTVFQF